VAGVTGIRVELLPVEVQVALDQVELLFGARKLLLGFLQRRFLFLDLLVFSLAVGAGSSRLRGLVGSFGRRPGSHAVHVRALSGWEVVVGPDACGVAPAPLLLARVPCQVPERPLLVLSKRRR